MNQYWPKRRQQRLPPRPKLPSIFHDAFLADIHARFKNPDRMPRRERLSKSWKLLFRGCTRRVMTNRAATVKERFLSAKPDRFLTDAALLSRRS